jgi:two-component system LytT family response regulator
MKVPIEELNRTCFVDTGTIKWFEADGNSTAMWLTDNSKILSTKILKHYNTMFHGKGFYRIHDKYLINLEHIFSHTRGRSIAVTMKCKTVLPVAVRRKSGFLEAIR